MKDGDFAHSEPALIDEDRLRYVYFESKKREYREYCLKEQRYYLRLQMQFCVLALINVASFIWLTVLGNNWFGCINGAVTLLMVCDICRCQTEREYWVSQELK